MRAAERRRFQQPLAGKRAAGGGAPAGSGSRSSSESGRARAGTRSRSRAREPGAGDPERRARKGPPRGVRASEEGTEGAGDPSAAYPARRRPSVLASPVCPPPPPAAAGGALPRSWPAARDHGDDHIHTESKFTKIRVKPPATYLYS